MAAFEYIAVNQKGKNIRGLIEGDTAKHARQQLREKSLLPVSLNEVSKKTEKNDKSFFASRRRMSGADLSLITRQFATLVRAGLPLEEALRVMSEQTEKKKIKSVVLGVRSQIKEGQSLARSLASFPNAFPEIYRATIAAGEQSGHLDNVLEKLADYTEERLSMNQTVLQALLYPALLVLVAFTVIAVLMLKVIPKVVAVFDSFDSELPLLTRTLISISDFFAKHGLSSLIVAVAVFFIGAWLLRQPIIRARYHALLLKLPLISHLVRGINTGRFTRTLSILAGSGVPILDGLRISSDVVSNIPMKKAIEETAVRVREGAAISQSLGSHKLFSPMTVHLIGSGETSGKLEEMLERAAQNQEREVNNLISTMLALLEPLLILIMGVVVLLIVLAVLLPIININDLVQT